MPPGDGDDGDGEEEHQQPQLLISLLQRGQQRLEAREVAHKLGGETISGVIEIFTIFGECASTPWNNEKEVPRWGVAEIQKMSTSTTGRCK